MKMGPIFWREIKGWCQTLRRSFWSHIFPKKKMHEVSAWCHFYVNHHQTTMFYHSKSPFFNLPFGEYVLFPKHLRVVNRIVQWHRLRSIVDAFEHAKAALLASSHPEAIIGAMVDLGWKTPQGMTRILWRKFHEVCHICFLAFVRDLATKSKKQWNWWRIFPRRLPHWDVQAVIEEWQRIILGNRHATIFSNGDLFLDDFCRSNQISNMGPSGVVK